MFKFIAKGIEVEMFVGICDFEYHKKQKVIVNVEAKGSPTFNPTHITECLDYSKVCTFVNTWNDRPHVELIETLLVEVIQFCFNSDQRIEEVYVEILKPEVIPNTQYVGIAAQLTRQQFINQTFN